MSGHTAPSVDVGTVRRYTAAFVTVLWKGTLIGGVAGMNTFVHHQNRLSPSFVPAVFPVAAIVVVSAATVFVQDDLRQGIAISLVALTVGFAVHVAAWTAPLFLAGFDPLTAEVLAPGFSGRGFLSALWFLPFAYAAGYFGMLTVVGYVLE